MVTDATPTAEPGGQRSVSSTSVLKIAHRALRYGIRVTDQTRWQVEVQILRERHRQPLAAVWLIASVLVSSNGCDPACVAGVPSSSDGDSS